MDDDFIPGFARKNKVPPTVAEVDPVAVQEPVSVTVIASEPEEAPAPAKTFLEIGIEYHKKAELQRQRYEKARVALDRWERKQRIAAGRVAKYAAQVKRYEKVLGVRT